MTFGYRALPPTLCRRSLLASLLVAPILFAPFAWAQNSPSERDARSAELYRAACATCHGADGRGRTSAELGFDIPLPDFTDCDFASREPNPDWGAIIHEGGPVRGFDRMMPSFGEALTDDEIELALVHLRSFCRNPDWPRGELNLPRALFTEKAYPEDEAVIETTIATEGDDSITHKFVWEQRFGTRNQMEISLPVTRADLGGSDGWTNGVGDLALGIKHVLLHNLESGSILSVGGELALSTGDEQRGFGKGSNVFETYLSYGKMLPRNSFVQLQAIGEFPTENGFDDEMSLRGVFGRTWTADGPYGRAWTPMIEVLGARDWVGGADTNWDVVPQFQVTLNRRQHVIAAAGVRVPVTDRSVRETELVFYLLWDWFDGGVLEGW